MTKDWQPKFLECLAAGMSVSQAVKTAGVNRKNLNLARKADSEFAEAWDAAIESGTDALEAVAIERAKSYSDQLLMFMLKARRPDVYGDKQKLEISRGVDFKEARDELERMARKLLEEEETPLLIEGGKK
jgi:hypothetical protein